jgi:hypothetical protein
MQKAARLVASLSPLAFVPQVYAQQNIKLPPPEGFKIVDLGLFVSRVIGIALIIAGILVFVYLVWGGIQWITSGGDKAKTEEARGRITAALVGLAIVASAYAVMRLVSYFFGINVFDSNSIPTAF